MAEAAPAPPPPPPAGRPDEEHRLFQHVVDDAREADWGFVVVRTAYAADDATDARTWPRALARLRRAAALNDAAVLATPVMAGPRGARYSDVRSAWAAWSARYLEAQSGRDDGFDWPPALRRDCCLVIDAGALASLLRPDDDGDDGDEDKPYAVVVDARDPRTVAYSGGLPYAGWLRVAAGAEALRSLHGALDGLSLGEEICPPRRYLGQAPLYDGGHPLARLVDPPGGDRGCYRFPGAGGTVRGRERADALLRRVLAEAGDEVYE